MQPSSPSPIKLCVAVPYYHDAPALFFRALQDLYRRPPCQLAAIDIIGDSLVTRVRNSLTAKFLASDCTHLLFIDSDIIFNPAHIGRIISHDLAAHPVIGGVYPKKRLGEHWVLNTFEGGPNEPDENGLLRAKYIGTGFMIISRAVLEKIQQHFPERAYIADGDETDQTSPRFDFFPAGPRNLILPTLPDLVPGQERYLSEDWAFCELVRAVGHDVVIDTECRLQHLGAVHYPVMPADVLHPQAVTDISIGQKVQSYLENVRVHHSNATTDHGELRLIDVDALVANIAPPPPAAAPPAAAVPPPLAAFDSNTSNTNIAAA